MRWAPFYAAAFAAAVGLFAVMHAPKDMSDLRDQVQGSVKAIDEAEVRARRRAEWERSVAEIASASEPSRVSRSESTGTHYVRIGKGCGLILTASGMHCRLDGDSFAPCAKPGCSGECANLNPNPTQPDRRAKR